MKNKKLWFVVVVLIGVVAVGGYFGFRNVNQANLIKTANSSHSGDARYVSFGADYIFAVPSSFVVDESSIPGVQLLVPANGASLSVSSFDQLFDATVVAVQPVSKIAPKDSKALKDYLEQTVLPDLRKNISPDISVTYKLVGKYQSASITVRKDGQQVRWMYAYGGAHPYIITAKEKTDVSTEVATTLLAVGDSVVNGDINVIKKVAQADMSLLIQGKTQELLDSGSNDFKQKILLKDLTTAVSNAGNLLRRNIVILGGTLQNDQFSGQLYFTPPTKDDQPSIGTVTLQKEGGQWKVSGFQLPTAPPPKK